MHLAGEAPRDGNRRWWLFLTGLLEPDNRWLRPAQGRPLPPQTPVHRVSHHHTSPSFTLFHSVLMVSNGQQLQVTTVGKHWHF